jgi:hypothetical protein
MAGVKTRFRYTRISMAIVSNWTLTFPLAMDLITRKVATFSVFISTLGIPSVDEF